MSSFLEGYREDIDAADIEPFVFHIPASAIVFGFCAGKSFEKRHKSEA